MTRTLISQNRRTGEKHRLNVLHDVFFADKCADIASVSGRTVDQVRDVLSNGGEVVTAGYCYWLVIEEK